MTKLEKEDIKYEKYTFQKRTSTSLLLRGTNVRVRIIVQNFILGQRTFFRDQRLVTTVRFSFFFNLSDLIKHIFYFILFDLFGATRGRRDNTVTPARNRERAT